MQLNEYTVKEQFIEKHKSLFSKAQVEWLIRQRTNNGLNNSGALMKISNRW